MRKIKKAVRLVYKGMFFLVTEGPKSTVRRIKDFLYQRECAMGVPYNDQYTVRHFIPYASEYQDNIVFDGRKTDIKTIAFYLPQFHRIPENDEWWGEGFTEWTNVKKGTPRFKGHYQPRAPHDDISYYDLGDITVMRNQVELAKMHGIYGFCFYYYWFSGRRLLEKPLDAFIENKDIDFHFCLCWANENWTRTWDGAKNDVLMEQKYEEQDKKNFIDDIKKYIDDSRYIMINGKPLIIVYNPGEIPNIHDTFDTWRKRAKEIGIGDIIIWTCQTANNTADSLDIKKDIDGELEFPPHNMWDEELYARGIDTGGREALIFNYQKLLSLLELKYKRNKKSGKNIHHTIMMGWDNAARKEKKWCTFYAYSLRNFYAWLRLAIDDTRNTFEESERLLFINAWNEWGEGTYLEPDKAYGYANINTLSKALFGDPFKHDEAYLLNPPSIKGISSKIAIQIHVFYVEVLPEIIENINKIPFEFDCLVTTDTERKRGEIYNILKETCKASFFVVDMYDNRGRDVAPFVFQMRKYINNYTYVCHLHTKKTKGSGYGDYWRKYLLKHLLGNSENIASIIEAFEKDVTLGMIYPETYPIVRNQAYWGGNADKCVELAERLDLKKYFDSEPEFPVGNMFWARTEAIKKLIESNISRDDFQEETGQLNQTLAHQIERIWITLIKSEGYSFIKSFNHFEEGVIEKKNRIAFFAHYDEKDVISEDDIHYLRELKKVAAEIIFISNSKLSSTEVDKIEGITKHVLIRINTGYDFAMWKEGISNIGWSTINEYDEMILANNSCICTERGFEYVFKEMGKKQCDFWGITIFPYLKDGSFINEDCIPRHIQSYFMTFRKGMIQNKDFQSYWNGLVCYNDMINTVKYIESKMTQKFEKIGFKGEVFIEDSGIFAQENGDWTFMNSRPYQMLILGSPLYKKKSIRYADKDEAEKCILFLNKN